MILLIDNYDSFTYNLYQLIGNQNPDIKVIRNDEMCVEAIKKLSLTHVVLSPGSGKPRDAGICIDVVKQLGGVMPILGVCLGHQAIYEAFGGTVSYAKNLMHGKQSDALLDVNCSLFTGIKSMIKVARYHSLAGVVDTLPSCLRIAAKTIEGEIMAVAHKKEHIYGLQFHPESILTTDGDKIIKNFLEVHYD
ncbi:MAG: anthranilate synthase component II [Eubacteriaceae bacterium]